MLEYSIQYSTRVLEYEYLTSTSICSLIKSIPQHHYDTNLTADRVEAAINHTFTMLCVQTDCVVTRLEDKVSYQKQPEERPRRVSFGRACIVADAETNTLTMEQRNLLWYSQKELKAIRKHVTRILKGNVNADGIEESRRGLEFMADEARRLRTVTKIDVILDLQEDNRLQKLPASKGLKDLASRLSKLDVRCSVLEAAKDAIAANDIYMESMHDQDVDTMP